MPESFCDTIFPTSMVICNRMSKRGSYRSGSPYAKVQKECVETGWTGNARWSHLHKENSLAQDRHWTVIWMKQERSCRSKRNISWMLQSQTFHCQEGWKRAFQQKSGLEKVAVYRSRHGSDPKRAGPKDGPIHQSGQYWYGLGHEHGSEWRELSKLATVFNSNGSRMAVIHSPSTDSHSSKSCVIMSMMERRTFFVWSWLGTGQKVRHVDKGNIVGSTHR